VQSNATRGHVLLIDDELAVRESLASVLRHFELSVTTAADGEEGIELALSEQPDVIIVDLLLPKKHGLEVIDELRSRGLRQEIIAITGHSPTEFERPALGRGADHWLAKPFDPTTLVMYIDVALRRAREYAPTTPVTHGDFTFDPLTGAAHRGTRVFSLSPTERRLVSYGLANAGRPLSVAEMRRAGWSNYATAHHNDLSRNAEHAVEVALSRLGTKLNGPDEQAMVKSVSANGRRLGYQFDIPTTPSLQTLAAATTNHRPPATAPAFSASASHDALN
jgi:DNA-binding response OmpR family regulator